MTSWNEIYAAAVAFRRQMHRRPELTWAEVQTAQAIRASLDAWKIPWRSHAETGTVATLARDASGRHIALRADIDALPINEATSLPWESENPGCMHACGHDGHTASLLATGWWLKTHEAVLAGPVTLLFQPAEEGGHGAKKMIEEGALEGIDTIYGWHNWPAIPFGQAVCPDGPVMAANATFKIVLQGRGGHASQPECCADPVLAAAAITMALQQVVSRKIAPQEATVLSVTSIDAPSNNTVIPDSAILGGSVRVANTRLRETIGRLITEVSGEIARGYGVEASVEYFPRYGATVNDAGASRAFRDVLAEEFGDAWQDKVIATPIMASEDFSYYLNAIPGAFALVGADDGRGHDEPCHSPRFDFNDQLIPRVVRLFCRLVRAPLPPVDADIGGTRISETKEVR